MLSEYMSETSFLLCKKTGNENDIKLYVCRHIKFFSHFTVNIKQVYKICI